MSKSLQNLVLLDPENTMFQTIDASLLGYDSKKSGNKVTFQTAEKIDNSSVLSGQMRMEKMGLVVWLDRAKVKDFMRKATPAGMDQNHEGPLRSLLMALQEVQATAAGADSGMLPSGKYINPLLDELLKLFGDAV